jgi:transketolase
LQVLRGFGFEVVELTEGHGVAEVAEAWASAQGKHVVVVCHTRKGYPRHMEPETHPVTGLEWQPWHTKIPSWAAYIALVDDLIAHSGCAATASEWEKHKTNTLTVAAAAELPNTQRPGVDGGQGTGKAFGEHVVKMLESNTKLAIVDADLATSCGE